MMEPEQPQPSPQAGSGWHHEPPARPHPDALRGPAVPPVPPGHPPADASPPGYGGQPRHSVTGAGAWWAGLTVLFLLPFLSSLGAGAAQWIIGRGQRRHGPLATENGRRAANWGMTYLISTVVLVGGHFLLLWVLTRDGSRIDGFFPFGILITLWLAHTLVHIILSVWGGIVAGAGRVFRANGIPFLR